jgi:DNA replication ATP-dependent helicase Dna2
MRFFVFLSSCRAVFVDTDSLPALDSRAGDNVQNATEADLVRQLAETLIRCGVAESQIGILSLYRQQVKLLRHLLRDRQGVEILTADRSQGRDKDCIIISLVRSNEDGIVSSKVLK